METDESKSQQTCLTKELLTPFESPIDSTDMQDDFLRIGGRLVYGMYTHQKGKFRNDAAGHHCCR